MQAEELATHHWLNLQGEEKGPQSQFYSFLSFLRSATPFYFLFPSQWKGCWLAGWNPATFSVRHKPGKTSKTSSNQRVKRLRSWQSWWRTQENEGPISRQRKKKKKALNCDAWLGALRDLIRWSIRSSAIAWSKGETVWLLNSNVDTAVCLSYESGGFIPDTSRLPRQWVIGTRSRRVWFDVNDRTVYFLW